MTNEQLSAFTALGLIIEYSPHSLAEAEDQEALKRQVDEVVKYLSPQVDDDEDVLSSIMEVLRGAVQEAKEKNT
jgi:hypothetical protein